VVGKIGVAYLEANGDIDEAIQIVRDTYSEIEQNQVREIIAFLLKSGFLNEKVVPPPPAGQSGLTPPASPLGSSPELKRGPENASKSDLTPKDSGILEGAKWTVIEQSDDVDVYHVVLRGKDITIVAERHPWSGEPHQAVQDALAEALHHPPEWVVLQ
jgi:hypothetical protein